MIEIQKRSSTRSYLDKPVEEEKLQQLLTAALQAPTAANMQEIHFSVVYKSNHILKEIDIQKNSLREVPSEKIFYFDAPVVIFLSAKEDFRWSMLDSGIAVENIALEAEHLGIGSLIIGSVYDALHSDKKEYFGKKLAFPEGYGFTIAIALGYKAAEKQPHDFDKEKQISIIC